MSIFVSSRRFELRSCGSDLAWVNPYCQKYLLSERQHGEGSTWVLRRPTNQEWACCEQRVQAALEAVTGLVDKYRVLLRPTRSVYLPCKVEVDKKVRDDLWLQPWHAYDLKGEGWMGLADMRAAAEGDEPRAAALLLGCVEGMHGAWKLLSGANLVHLGLTEACFVCREVHGPLPGMLRTDVALWDLTYVVETQTQFQLTDRPQRSGALMDGSASHPVQIPIEVAQAYGSLSATSATKEYMASAVASLLEGVARSLNYNKRLVEPCRDAFRRAKEGTMSLDMLAVSLKSVVLGKA